MCGVCFEDYNFEVLTGFEFCREEFPTLVGPAVDVKRMVKRIEDAKSESGGAGELEQMKTGGKGRIRRQSSDGGRHGFIGGDGKVLSDGHGHEHGSSVASPLGSSPLAHH